MNSRSEHAYVQTGRPSKVIFVSATLYLLTGPWASGKTTVIPPLRRLLPEVVIFDWDVLLPGLSLAVGADASREPSTWAGLHEMWVAVLASVLASDRDVLLCGPATPPDLRDGRLARYPICCAYLDCRDDVLAERLQARGVAEHEAADEIEFLTQLRNSGYRATSVHERTPHRIAEDIAAWVRMS